MSQPSGLSRIVLTVWTYFLIFAIGGLGFVLQCLLLPLTWPFDRGRIITGRIYRGAAIGVTKFNPLWDFRVLEPAPPYKPRRTVVVSNHCSQTDPFLISHVPWEMKWLGKSSLFVVPIIGWSMWLAGDIAVTRGNSKSAKKAMARCRHYLEGGTPVIIFPEGTRSLDGDVREFRAGVALLALRSGAPVLPISIEGSRRVWPKGRSLPRMGAGPVRLVFGEPVTYQRPAKAEEAAADLRRRVLDLRGAGQGAVARDGADARGEPRGGPSR